MKSIVLSTLFLLFLSFPAAAQNQSDSLNHSQNDTIYRWEGFFIPFNQKEKQETPIILEYQIPVFSTNDYLKDLRFGKLEIPAESESFTLLGFLVDSEDLSYRDYLMNEKGEVVHTLLLGKAAEGLEGYMTDPTADEFEGILRLTPGSTSISADSLAGEPEEIVGSYRYDFGPNRPKGQLLVQSDKPGFVDIAIASEEKEGVGKVAIQRDSIPVSGTSLAFAVEEFGNKGDTVQIRFYKNIAVVRFREASAAVGEFGKKATVEGVYIKQK